VENSGEDEESAHTTVLPNESATDEKRKGFRSKPADLPLPERETTGKAQYLSTSLLACPARNPASPGENGRFTLLHNREYAGIEPIHLCCLSAGVVVFLLAENRKLPVRIGMGAIAFFLMSLIVTLLVVL
jgi:hypothetical protein